MRGFENVYTQKDTTHCQLSERRCTSRLITVGGGVNSRDKFFLPLVKSSSTVSGPATSSSGSGKHGGRGRGTGLSRGDVLGVEAQSKLSATKGG